VDRAAFHPLPSGLPPERAILAPNVETALNAVWDAGIGPGDRVTVVGAGVVGCLVAWLAAGVRGCRATLVDVLPERAFVAERLGCAFATVAPAEQDVVVHASATSAGLAAALDAAGEEAVVLEVSWYGDTPVTAPLGAAFHPRRLTLRSSQVARIPPARAPRWTHARRLATVLELLNDPVLDALIDSEGTFAGLPGDLPGVFTTPTLAHRVRY
ncbi:MAG: dehydrogenase, partial [Myxococcales bacterium]|nr:dehydrogenase [Myxococcales bacterium]